MRPGRVIGGAARPPVAIVSRTNGVPMATPSPKGDVRAPLGEPPVDIFGQMMVLPPLCRPGGWVVLWKRLAMMGKLNARGWA